jgi:hypothetical protein
LIVPARNFAAAFPELGYKGIKAIVDERKVTYSNTTIIQASDLKQKLESLNLLHGNCTILSLDAVDFYPSIRFKLVLLAVHHSSQNLPEHLHATIDGCLGLIQFGMANNFICFQDQYYGCDGGKDPNERGLAIGGFESAWLLIWWTPTSCM